MATIDECLKYCKGIDTTKDCYNHNIKTGQCKVYDHYMTMMENNKLNYKR